MNLLDGYDFNSTNKILLTIRNIVERLPYDILGTGPQEEHLFQTFQHDGGDSEHEDQMRHVASALGLNRTNTVANTAGVTVNAWFIALRG
ncbi:hypothetical protein G6F68_002230 [Rhizopus microsporus]|nr:hypothetical protein G6F67_003229 [Rhizopus microsporus]KAG1267069.1 hypothetical protein G6F68_002230 [Rhizopus microsporus]